MSELVLDASAAITWLLAEDDALARRVAQRAADSTLLVPVIWHAEMANALLQAQRRGRISPAQARQALVLIAEMEIETDYPAPDAERTHTIARDSGLTAYDALYLELALRKRRPLGTTDAPLASVARKSGVKLAFD